MAQDRDVGGGRRTALPRHRLVLGEDDHPLAVATAARNSAAGAAPRLAARTPCARRGSGRRSWTAGRRDKRGYDRRLKQQPRHLAGGSVCESSVSLNSPCAVSRGRCSQSRARLGRAWRVRGAMLLGGHAIAFEARPKPMGMALSDPRSRCPPGLDRRNRQNRYIYTDRFAPAWTPMKHPLAQTVSLKLAKPESPMHWPSIDAKQ